MADLEDINNSINHMNNILNRNIQYQLHTRINKSHDNDDVSINRFHSLIYSVNTNLSALASNLQKINGSFPTGSSQNNNNGDSLSSMLHGYGITNQALASHIASVVGSESTPKQPVHRTTASASHTNRYTVPITHLQRQFYHTNQRAHTLGEQVHRVQGRASRVNTISGMREHYRDIQGSYANDISNIKRVMNPLASRINTDRTRRNTAIEALERQDNGLPNHLNSSILNSLNNRSIVRNLANGTGPNATSARDYLDANSHYQQDTQAYSESISQLRKLSQSASDASERLDNLFNNPSSGFLSNLTTNKAEALGNSNETYVHYPSSTPTGLIQDLGGVPGLSASGIFAATGAVNRANVQGNTLRQQMESGVNSLTMGRAINGTHAPQHHIDDHVTDHLMDEGRWLGENAQNMSQFLGALSGTRNTSAVNQDRAAGDVAQFSRYNNVNPTDTTQLFSTLSNAGGLGDHNDRGNIVDFTRQFAGMLHNDHLGSVSGQQAEGLNSIFGNMLGSGQTLTPQTVSNVAALQSQLSTGAGGRVFQGQQGAQQLNSFSQGIGSSFNNMLVRNAFANGEGKYGGQQGLYQLALDMREPLKHPGNMVSMIQNLASSGLGRAGTELQLSNMGLGPSAARHMYNEAMSGNLNPNTLHSIERRNRNTGRRTTQHARRQYRLQGNSTLDIKVAMDQRGRMHTSEAVDSPRNLLNHFRSAYSRGGLMSILGSGAKGIISTMVSAGGLASVFGLLTGRNGSVMSRGLLHTRLNPLNWLRSKKGSYLFRNSRSPLLRRIGRGISGAGNSINAQNGNRYNNNVFTDNHFEGSTNSSNSSGNSDNGPSDNGSSNSSSQESSSGDSSTDTDNESYEDKRDDLKNRYDKARKNGETGEAKDLRSRIDDLDHDHLRNGGYGDRFNRWLHTGRTNQALNWLNHGRTGNAMNWLRNGRTGRLLSGGHNALTRGLNWLGHGRTGRGLRLLHRVARPGMTYASPSGSSLLSHIHLPHRNASNVGHIVNADKALAPTSKIASSARKLGGLSKLGRLSKFGGHLGGPLATVSMLAGANSYLNHPTWNKTKDMGSNGVNALVDGSNPIGWGLTGAQALGGAVGHATGDKLYNAVSRVANVGDDIFHPIKNGKGIWNDLKSSARFTRKHPVESLLSHNFATAPFEVAYRNRHKIGRGMHRARNAIHSFMQNPGKSIGNGLHRLGSAVGRGWRGLKSHAGAAIGAIGHGILGVAGAHVLDRNYLYLRQINRLLPNLASKLEGLFGNVSYSGNAHPTDTSSGMLNADNRVFTTNSSTTNNHNNNGNNIDKSVHYNFAPGILSNVKSALQNAGAGLMDFFGTNHSMDTY